MYTSTDAIILKNIPYKESSIISRIFTHHHGKISIIFKGAKRAKNNISGIIEPGNLVSITYYNNVSSLKTSREVQIKKIYYNTRKIIDNYYYTMATISILDKLSHENHPEPNIFTLSTRIFDDIDNEKANIDVIFTYFLFQLSKLLGFQLIYPNLENVLISKLNKEESDISEIQKVLSNDKDLLKKIKMLIYKHYKEHIIDLNELPTIKALKNYGKPLRSN